MQYQEMVTEARGLLQREKDTRNRLITLTVEAVKQVTQAEWATDIGAHRNTVKDWVRYNRETAGQGAAAPSYDDWYRSTRRDESDRGVSGFRTMPPERKAEIVREALADPDVARETFNAAQPDDETAAKARMHAGSAITRHDQRIQRHLGEKRHDEAAAKGRTDQEALYEVSAMMQVLADVVVTGGKLAHKLSEGATISSGMRQTLAGYATKAKATIEWLEGIEDQQHAEDVDEVLRVWAAEA